MAELSGPAANYVVTLQGNQPQAQIDAYRRLNPAQQREVRQWLTTRPEAGPLATRFDALMGQIGQPQLESMAIRADSSLLNDQTRPIHDLLRADPRTAGMFSRNADLTEADVRTMRSVVEQRALAQGTSHDAYEAWSTFLREAVDGNGGLDFRMTGDAVRYVGREMGSRNLYPTNNQPPLMSGFEEGERTRGNFHGGIVSALRDLRVPRGEIGAGTIDQIKSAVQGERFGEYLRDFALNPDSPFRLQNLSQGARERLAREAGAYGLDRSILARVGGSDARALARLETHYRSGAETAARAATIQREGIERGTPPHVTERFSIHLQNDQQTLTIDPAAPSGPRMRSTARVTDSFRGGKNIAFGPEESPFTITGARWETTTIARALPNITNEQRARLGNIDLNQPVTAMRVSVSERGEGDTLLVYQPGSSTVSTICLGSGQVGSFDIRAPGGIEAPSGLLLPRDPHDRDHARRRER